MLKETTKQIFQCDVIGCNNICECEQDGSPESPWAFIEPASPDVTYGIDICGECMARIFGKEKTLQIEECKTE